MSQETVNVRYSDEELDEFREYVVCKLAIAESNWNFYYPIAHNGENEAGDETDKIVTLDEKDSAGRQLANLKPFISGLKAALVSIENKTYGICRETGKLIPKDRLRAVPHTTVCIEAKN